MAYLHGLNGSTSLLDFFHQSAGPNATTIYDKYLIAAENARSWSDLFSILTVTNPELGVSSNTGYGYVPGTNYIYKAYSILSSKPWGDPWQSQRKWYGPYNIPSVNPYNGFFNSTMSWWDIRNPEQLSLARAIFAVSQAKSAVPLGTPPDATPGGFDKLFMTGVTTALSIAGAVTGAAVLGPLLGPSAVSGSIFSATEAATIGSGAGAGFTSGFVSSDEPLQGAIKGAIKGAIGGEIAGSIALISNAGNLSPTVFETPSLSTFVSSPVKTVSDVISNVFSPLAIPQNASLGTEGSWLYNVSVNDLTDAGYTQSEINQLAAMAVDQGVATEASNIIVSNLTNNSFTKDDVNKIIGDAKTVKALATGVAKILLTNKIKNTPISVSPTQSALPYTGPLLSPETNIQQAPAQNNLTNALPYVLLGVSGLLIILAARR